MYKTAHNSGVGNGRFAGGRGATEVEEERPLDLLLGIEEDAAGGLGAKAPEGGGATPPELIFSNDPFRKGDGQRKYE